MARYESPTQEFTAMYFAAERGRDGQKRKLCNNTYVYIIDPDTVAVRYHYTDICTYYRDGTVIIDTDGWWTVTTKERLNAFSPYYTWSLKGEWFISETYASNRDDAGKEAYPMYETMRFLPDRRKNPQAFLSGKWVPVPSLCTLERQRQREREKTARQKERIRAKQRKAREMGNWLMRNDMCEYALLNWLEDPSNKWKQVVRARTFADIEKAIIETPDKLRDDLKRAIYENLPTCVREKVVQAWQEGRTDITFTDNELEKRVIEIEVHDDRPEEAAARGTVPAAVGGATEGGGSGEGAITPAGVLAESLPTV